MISIKKFIFNSFQVNTYLLYDDSGDCIVVDPACYAEEDEKVLVSFMADNELTPVLQVYTHCHIDHILGLHFMQRTYDLPVVTHTEEVKILKNGHIMGQVFGFNREEFPGPDRTVEHGEALDFGNSRLKVFHVPGHSPGSLAYYSEEGGFALTGDALFEGSIGRTDLPGGNYDTLIDSIRLNLFTLPGETIIYPGHGDASTIEKEKTTNPFFE